METGALKLNGTEIKYSFLKDNNNCWVQFFYSIIPEIAEPILDQIKTIEKAETELFRTFKINRD